jgi:hypothetical protein
MEKKRPVGIIVCSILAIIWSLGYFGLLYMVIPMVHRSLSVLQYIICLSMAIVYLISAVFLLALKKWARLLIILITSFYTVTSLFSIGPMAISMIRTLLAHKEPNANYGIIWLMLILNLSIMSILIGIIVYLIRPKLKEQFQ